MRTVLSTFILLAIVGVFIADGVSMYNAHREAVNFSAKAAQEAAQAYVDTRGNEDAVHRSIQDMAIDKGVELTGISFHKGTTRWYAVSIKVHSGGLLLKHLPFVQDLTVQEATSIEHF
jgi:hypothetical protein